MELLGIALWIGAGIPAAPLVCWMLVRFVRPHRAIANFVFMLCVFGTIVFAMDLALVGSSGAIRSREIVGAAFFPVHTVATLLSAASFAGTVLLGPIADSHHWRAVAVICWCLGVLSIFYHIEVAESLYGIDGAAIPNEISDRKVASHRQRK